MVGRLRRTTWDQGRGCGVSGRIGRGGGGGGEGGRRCGDAGGLVGLRLVVLVRGGRAGFLAVWEGG